MNQIEQFAREHNVDAGCLADLVGFLRHNIQGAVAAGIDMSIPANVSHYIAEGVKAWRDRREAQLLELAAGESEWAQAWRAEMCGRVYDTIRAQQAA